MPTTRFHFIQRLFRNALCNKLVVHNTAVMHAMANIRPAWQAQFGQCNSRYFGGSVIKPEATAEKDLSVTANDHPSFDPNGSGEALNGSAEAHSSLYLTASEIYEQNINVDDITGGDEEMRKKLRILCLEYDILKQEGETVPAILTREHWKYLLTLDTRAKRKKYFKFILLTEKKKEKDKRKKVEKAQRNAERRAQEKPEETGHLKYGLGHNSLLLRVYDTKMNEAMHYNLIRAMLWGQKIVIDCDYDFHMTPAEIGYCAKQISLAFSANRSHNNPYDLYLCNAKNNSQTIQLVKKLIPNLFDAEFPINIKEESYLDIFPKENIVYLTPHCKEELLQYDDDAVYIIGGIVDKATAEPLSLGKAKREGLKMAKLPLDRYLMWGTSSGKSLTLNQMVDIMLDFKDTHDWNVALQHVPRRKLKRPEELMETQNMPTKRRVLSQQDIYHQNKLLFLDRLKQESTERTQQESTERRRHASTERSRPRH